MHYCIQYRISRLEQLSVFYEPTCLQLYCIGGMYAPAYYTAGRSGESLQMIVLKLNFKHVEKLLWIDGLGFQ